MDGAPFSVIVPSFPNTKICAASTIHNIAILFCEPPFEVIGAPRCRVDGLRGPGSRGAWGKVSMCLCTKITGSRSSAGMCWAW